MMEGYSMYLGFQTMSIFPFALKMAADLSWCCTK